MKKIITLLFSVGAFATSFAQNNHWQNNDDRNYRTENKRDDQYANSSNRNDKHRGHFNKGNYNSAKEREFQVAKINRDFDFQIKAIQRDRYLRRREKKAAIRNAERERSRQIQMVYERFNHNHNWNR